ncbi:MAG: trypsin-like peptidase domain-containing protein [Ruminococcus sp.]|nr:trypsin-like peptidase domain-containing protein [Ruminococcus sp.]
MDKDLDDIINEYNAKKSIEKNTAAAQNNTARNFEADNEALNDEPKKFVADDKESKKTYSKNQSRLEYINLTLPSPDEADFWSNAATQKPAKSKKIFWIIGFIIIVALIIGYSVMLQHGKGWLSNLFSEDNVEFTLPIAETPELDGKYVNEDGTYTAAGVAKAVLSTVVQVNVYEETAVIPSSQGSGIIISEDGYIVTNAHVVSDADFGITVTLYDDTEYSAKIIGSDDSTDIAVIKIDAEDLTPAQFADSDLCELGDEVVTIGSPAGYSNSVTKGIISGLNRQIHAENSAVAMNCIQIDAAINPGNSGGALFNMYGQVIGITSSKLISTSYDNIGFAITVNSAKPIIEELMENGFIPDRGKIGISYYFITEEAANLNDLVCGLYVAAIDEDCNVAQTDLQVGDIITSLNGVQITSTDDVTEVMNDMRAGDEMVCMVVRLSDDGNEEFTITFELDSDETAIIEADEDSE